MWVVLLLVLAGFSYMDVREKALPTWMLCAGIVLSAVPAAAKIKDWRDLMTVAAGMLPGIIMTLLALALRGNLGCGDGLVLIMIGNLVGLKECLLIMTAAVMLSFVYSCLLLTVFRKSKNYCFPFIPFYFLGEVIIRLIAAGQKMWH